MLIKKMRRWLSRWGLLLSIIAAAAFSSGELQAGDWSSNYNFMPDVSQAANLSLQQADVSDNLGRPFTSGWYKGSNSITDFKTQLQQLSAGDLSGNLDFSKTVSAAMNGIFELTKKGSGTLTFDCGSVQVNGGILQAINGTLDVNGSGSSTGCTFVQGTSIYNSGLTKTGVGAGTLTVSGVNTYTGTTIINGGTLNISNGSALGATFNMNNGGCIGTVINNGTSILTLNPYASSGATPVTIQGGTVTVSGTRTLRLPTLNGGSILQAGNGIVITNSYIDYTGSTTFSGGTLNPGTIALGDPTRTFIIDPNTNLQLNPVTLVNGGLMKNGSGTLILSSTNTYTGSTTVSQGTLTLNGSAIDGTQTIGSISGISGAGSVLTINQPGTLTLNGGSIQSGTLRFLPNDAVFVGEVAGAGTMTLDPDSIAPLSLDSASVEQNTTTVGDGTQITINPLSNGLLPGLYSLTPVPEPSTLVLLVTAGLGLLTIRKWL